VAVETFKILLKIAEIRKHGVPQSLGFTLSSKVSDNAQTDVFTSIKYVQNVQNCWCNRH